MNKRILTKVIFLFMPAIAMSFLLLLFPSVFLIVESYVQENKMHGYLLIGACALWSVYVLVFLGKSKK
ncbi:hypothetical protein [Flavipsychrobacter stenotrophus]|uniref:hypothetical protein n=1 Tax=Flavipsychrobacter stenotrophus TaxID=2077091 RepID=UPI001056E703|nr:hypothetical protein [Flavipsychrobacter stenotrophus]